MRTGFYAVIGVALALTASADTAPWSEKVFPNILKQKDVAVLRENLEKGVTEGSSRAGCLMAYFISTGHLLSEERVRSQESFEPDHSRVFSLFDRLTFEDCLERPILLALMYRLGKGVRKDVPLAEHYFRKEVIFFGFAEDEDFRWNSIRLTETFDPGPDLRKALNWWLTVKNEKPPATLLKISRAYLRGDGERQDSDIGYRILRLAADKGSQEARQELAAAVNRGDIGAYVPGPTAYLMRRAKQRHVLDSIPVVFDHKRVGQTYRDGSQGKSRDPALAYIWFLSAEKAGDTSVTLALRELEKELPSEVIKWAHDWVDRGWWP